MKRDRDRNILAETDISACLREGQRMKVLVTGAAGQLGHDVVQLLEKKGVDCRGTDVADFDLTDGSAVMTAVRDYGPDVIVHCAAYTNVDRAETDPDMCFAVNAAGTRNMVSAAAEAGAKLVYISTDYVFPGQGTRPYAPEDDYGPLNVYGMSKMQGEMAVRTGMERYFILRTSWVFGLNGKNFVRTMLRLGSEKSEIRVVSDQVGSPTYTRDLAKTICDMIETEKYGIYHVRNEGFVSWAEFAGMIMRMSGRQCRVRPVSTEEYGSGTVRPLNSRLSGEKLTAAGFEPMPPVEDALKRYFKELGESTGAKL